MKLQNIPTAHTSKYFFECYANDVSQKMPS